MWVTVHMLSGLAVGSVVPGPLWVVVIVALVGHVLLDLTPHYDYVDLPHAFRWGSLDVAAATLVAVAALRYLPARAVVAGVVSAIPDLDVLNALLPFERRVRWFPSHWNSFPHGRAGPVPGILLQAVVSALSAYLVYRFGLAP